MQNRTPSAPNQGSPIPDFTPVPRNRNRFDGWTPERQHAFIEALATTGSVTDASKSVNMAPEGAYALKRADTLGDFAAAWDAALDFGVGTLSDLAIDRIRHGTPVPVFYKGEQVGERRRYNERLHMFMLRNPQPETYGRPASTAVPKASEAQRLEWQMEYVKEFEEQSQRHIDRMFTDLDRLRGEILRRCARDPDLRRAWELLCGEIDWPAIEGWQPGQPTQFARDNFTRPSTQIMLAQRINEGVRKHWWM